MALCGIVEKNKPACKERLDEEGVCPVHCSAKTPHGPCKRHHKKGRRRCHKHGGNSKRGIDHPNYREGKYVKERYRDFIDDPALSEAFEDAEQFHDQLSLRKEITLLDARTAVILRRLQHGEGPSLIRRAQEAFEKFASAQAAKKRDAALEAIQQLGQLLRRGVDEEDDWEKLEELAFERRPKLVESEIKRQQFQVEVIHMIVVERMLQLVAEVIRQNVKDSTAIENIETALVRIASDAAGSLTPGRRAGGRSH
jgi:hypothetical protein